MDLTIKFLGTGGAFDVEQGNSAAMVYHQNACFLIDCGHAVFPSLVRLGLADKVDGVLITHLHDDHVGSLSSFILYHALVLQKGKLKLYVPTRELEALLTGFLSYSLGEPSKRVDFLPVSAIKGLGFIDTTGRHVPGMHTYAYHFSNGQSSIVYSGDNGDADFLFGELEPLNLPNPTVFHEIFFHFPIFGHTYYQDLIPWTARYTIHGYHCDPSYAPPDNTVSLVAHHPEFLH